MERWNWLVTVEGSHETHVIRLGHESFPMGKLESRSRRRLQKISQPMVGEKYSDVVKRGIINGTGDVRGDEKRSIKMLILSRTCWNKRSCCNKTLRACFCTYPGTVFRPRPHAAWELSKMGHREWLQQCHWPTKEDQGASPKSHCRIYRKQPSWNTTWDILRVKKCHAPLWLQCTLISLFNEFW